MSLWAKSGERTPEEQFALDNKRVDTRDPLKILLSLEERAIGEIVTVDPLNDEPERLNVRQQYYVRNFIDKHIA